MLALNSIQKNNSPVHRFRTNNIQTFLLFLAALNLSACGTLDNGRAWGEDATITPSNSKIREAFISAASHPASWSPLLAATVLSATDLDKEISDQLSEETPLFGSNKDADDASDLLRDSLIASVVVSALAMPAGENTGEHLINKSKGLFTEAMVLKTTSLTTGILKDFVGRERPNKLSDHSFPSGHSSRAFAAAALTSKNLDSLSLGENTKTGFRVGLYTFATGTAWARVEAKVHYPVDVLAGAALGNFLSRFIHDAFLGLDHQNKMIQIQLMPKFSHISLHWEFN